MNTPSIRLIQEATAARFALTVSDIMSPRRHAPTVLPRQIAMFIARELTLRSLPEIGRFFGGRDHTTVLHACSKIASAVSQGEPIVTAAVRDIKFAVGCGAHAARVSASVVFQDADAVVAARRILEQDACRVSVDELRAMAGTILGICLPVIEEPEGETLPAPAPAPAFPQDAVAEALAAFAEWRQNEFSGSERSSRNRLHSAMTALRTVFERTKS